VELSVGCSVSFGSDLADLKVIETEFLLLRQTPLEAALGLFEFEMPTKFRCDEV
jgi:hypothetical protein